MWWVDLKAVKELLALSGKAVRIPHKGTQISMRWYLEPMKWKDPIPQPFDEACNVDWIRKPKHSAWEDHAEFVALKAGPMGMALG